MSQFDPHTKALILLLFAIRASGAVDHVLSLSSPNLILPSGKIRVGGYTPTTLVVAVEFDAMYISAPLGGLDAACISKLV